MSDENVNSLSVKQVKGIKALLEMPSIADVAQAVGVADRTVYRWMGDPLFVAALREAETAAIGDAVRSLITGIQANHAVMRDIRDTSRYSPAVRLRAAGMLDDSLMKWRNFQDFEMRLTDLERIIQAIE